MRKTDYPLNTYLFLVGGHNQIKVVASSQKKAEASVRYRVKKLFARTGQTPPSGLTYKFVCELFPKRRK
jgi:hypothetical protein